MLLPIENCCKKEHKVHIMWIDVCCWWEKIIEKDRKRQKKNIARKGMCIKDVARQGLRTKFHKGPSLISSKFSKFLCWSLSRLAPPTKFLKIRSKMRKISPTHQGTSEAPIFM